MNTTEACHVKRIAFLDGTYPLVMIDSIARALLRHRAVLVMTEATLCGPATSSTTYRLKERTR